MSGRTPAERYAELAAEFLRRPGVTLGRSLRSEVLQREGRIFGFLSDGGLVLKLPRRRCEQLVAEEVAAPFVNGTRTMREWVVVPSSRTPDGDQWRPLLEEAFRYAAPKGS